MHVQKGWEDGLYISSVSSASNLWAIVMDAGTEYSQQIYKVHPNSFLPKEWIMEKWEEGYYITAVAGSDNQSSLVVMSKGTRFTQQSYKVSDTFPYEWIKKKWKEGFFVTTMATCLVQWAVVMSKCSGIQDQVSGHDVCLGVRALPMQAARAHDDKRRVCLCTMWASFLRLGFIVSMMCAWVYALVQPGGACLRIHGEGLEPTPDMLSKAWSKVCH